MDAPPKAAPPPIRTHRLHLRPIVEADAPFIRTLLNEPSFLQYIGDRGVRTEEDARGYIEKGPAASYLRHGFGLLLVEEQVSGTAVGMCGILRREGLDDPDLGFAFLPAYWSRGFASEAAAAVLAHAGTALGLPRVVAIVQPDNPGSLRVLEKLGFTFERTVVLPGASVELRLLGRTLAGRGTPPLTPRTRTPEA